MKAASTVCLIAAVSFGWACGGAAMAAPGDAPNVNSANVTAAYPAEVALSDEGAKGFVFRRFPGSQRLYIYDLDSKDHSACNTGCVGARPPVVAPAASQPIGDWTIIKRDDGFRQWAYKGHPVYTLYHDAPGDPQGDGEGGVWHLLPYMK